MEGVSEPRRMRLTGLHHLTAICRDLERTTAFYRDLLGLELVREGASDDDPDARHFWFSAGGGGAPGTLISFLEYPSLPRGTVGTGAVQHFAFVVESRRGAGGVARLPARPRACSAPTSSSAAASARSTCATPTSTSSRSPRAGRASTPGPPQLAES